MAASDFLSQVDPTRYQPVAPGNANSVENSQQITPPNANNRSEYLKQLNGTLSQKKKPAEKSSRKTKTEKRPQPQQQQSPQPSKTDRSVAPKAKTEPAPISSPNEVTTKPEDRSVNNIKQQDVSQADQAKVKNQNAFVTEGKNSSEVLVPPASIEELFQIDELPEEVAEAITIETNNVDATTPPFGLVIALNQVETDHSDITTNQTENSENILADDATVLSVDHTVVVTNLVATQNESNNQQEVDIPAAQTPESVAQTQQTVDKTIAQPPILVEQLTDNTNKKKIEPSTETITENTSDEPLILPFPNNENKKEDNVVSESSTDNSAEQAETSPLAETPVAKQRITQIANEQPPIDFAPENKAPAAQASQQEATATTTINKKLSVTNQPANLQEAPELALSSTSFSEVFAEIDAVKNKEETANKSQAESILDQTVTAMETSIEQGQSLKIRLTPPELGTIHIQLTTNDAGAITARLDVQTPEAQAALMQHLQNLQETLQQNGTPVEQITIQMTPQTAEDQASGDSDQPKEQSAQQEDSEEDQQQNQKQQEQEEQPDESDDSDQLNIAA